MLAQETLKNKIAFYLQAFPIQILNIKQWTEFLAFVEKPLNRKMTLFFLILQNVKHIYSFSFPLPVRMYASIL